MNESLVWHKSWGIGYSHACHACTAFYLLSVPWLQLIYSHSIYSRSIHYVIHQFWTKCSVDCSIAVSLMAYSIMYQAFAIAVEFGNSAKLSVIFLITMPLGHLARYIIYINQCYLPLVVRLNNCTIQVASNTNSRHLNMVNQQRHPSYH